ncbi:receptor-like protein EIX1 [Cornus florida]|uniref:receptor-like protein EIX1 n=1 Tax=Cornus florida TaxID=4283 RepID=UPI0028A132ED|nr:receptor-like protein EIX1 [Cornus florida]
MIMDRYMRDVSILLLVFLTTIQTFYIIFCSGNSHMFCVENERQTLLRFKQSFNDPSNRLSSWAGEGDCCKWVGVVCDNLTGNVKELHLQNPLSDSVSATEHKAYVRSQLGGKLNPSLLNLKHLSYLDLSNNNFGGIQIPSFIGSLGSLRYLNLSKARFGGVIPYQLGNISSLHYLDLEGDFEGLIPHQLGNLSSLHYLVLGGGDFGRLYPIIFNGFLVIPCCSTLI